MRANTNRERKNPCLTNEISEYSFSVCLDVREGHAVDSLHEEDLLLLLRGSLRDALLAIAMETLANRIRQDYNVTFKENDAKPS